MNCFLCKGDMEAGQVTYTADLGHCIVIVKHVPALVCSQCGQVWYDGTVTEQLEKIVDALDKAITEIAVMNYPGQVA